MARVLVSSVQVHVRTEFAFGTEAIRVQRPFTRQEQKVAMAF